MAVYKTIEYGTDYIYLEFYNFGPLSVDRQLYFYIGTSSYSMELYDVAVIGPGETSCYCYFDADPGTNYYFKGELWNAAGDKLHNTYGPYSQRTYYGSDNATVSTSVTTDSITVNVNGITSRSYDRTVRYVLTNSAEAEPLIAYSTSSSHTFSGLERGKKYYLEVGIRNPDGYKTYFSGGFYATTQNYTYTITSVSSSATSSVVTIYLTISEAQEVEVPFKFTLYYNGEDRVSTGKMPIGNTSMKWQFTQVPSATRCEFTIYDTLRGLTFPADGSRYVRRTKNDFSWNANVNSGSVFDILAGSSTDGTWDGSWNDYTSQLKEKANYYGREYNPATVKKGDILTAEKMNNIAAVINWLVDNNKGDCETKLDHVDPGDPVTAKRIKLLAQCLNE